MTAIQNTGKSESYFVSPTDVGNTGASGRSAAPKSSALKDGVQMDGLISRVAQQASGAPANMAAGPVLRAPVRASDADFDVMTINTKSADLLIGFLLLMLQARAVEAKFNSAMTLKNADAVAGAVKAIKDGGLTTMATGVAAGVSGMVLTAFGAGSKAVGAHKGRVNDRNVVRPMQARQEETAKLSNTLNSAKSVKTADEIKALNVTDANGNNKVAPLTPSDAELSAANHAKIADTIKTNQVLDRADVLADDANRKTIGNWNTTGDLFMAMGALGGVISAGGQLDIAVKRAEEKSAGLEEKVAGLGADKARETGKAVAAIIDDFIRAMVTILQTRVSTAGSIADRIKG